MNHTRSNRREEKKKLITGILAHVDAGKTTLAESILYLSGKLRKLGRVDHKDAFLDTYELEKNRGITIFSKQARVELENVDITLLDTPGHVDFSAEMERTLQVLDYAILVISGADGVQGHVLTLWKLLKQYEIPVFLFINKMDQPGTQKEKLMEELKKRLDSACMEFGSEIQNEEFMENLAVCDETLLEEYLETGKIHKEQIVSLIAQRKVFPCYFGSALKLWGVEEFLQGFREFTRQPRYPSAFGARVYKIGRDAQGTRLTYMKITGGSLKVKTLLTNKKDGMSPDEIWEEKADQLRIYSGAGYEMKGEVCAGEICGVTGLTRTYCGQGLGIEKENFLPVLEPVLTYEIQLPPECDVHQMFLKLRQLEEEEPLLHIVWKEESGEIHAQVMGEVQIEILKSLIRERFQTEVEFGTGSIVYKETIEELTEGVGHFEPLRHYAEVHLLLEPLERGEGLVFDTVCSEDTLERNWQRLILTHLQEKEHRGVLTGSAITDMKITLASGKAHLKHTEGGDFRQATYRAIRQGLKKTKSILLEPVYEYQLEVPSQMVGRALADIQRMYGSFREPVLEGDTALISGTAPVATMRDYQTEVMAYTRGCGRLSCILKGYEPCHNAREVIEALGYDSERDQENPTGSVFCSHGAGYYVPWDQVEEHMHLESCLKKEESIQEAVLPVQKEAYSGMYGSWKDEKELEEIFARTYKSVKREKSPFKKRVRDYSPDPAVSSSRGASGKTSREKKEEYLLVDGYNIIFAWEDLKELAQVNIEGARNKLMDILSNYQGYKKNTLILVFDAYKVEGNQGEVQRYHNIYVVYTKEAETADQYIEKTVHEIGKKHQVTVATSDGLEQMIILGAGASRMSADGLRREIAAVNEEIRGTYLNRSQGNKNYLLDHLPGDMVDFVEEVRLGKRSFVDNGEQEKS